MRNKEQAIAQILDSIESLKHEIKVLEESFHQVISEESDQQELFVDAEIVEEDKKPAAKKKLSKAEQHLEGKRRAQEWAKSLKKSK
jgi:hypothetical protein